MKAHTGTGRQKGRQLRLLAGVVLAGSLVLAGCSGDEPEAEDGGGAQSQTDEAGDGDGGGGTDEAGSTDGGGADAEGATKEPSGPPTEPADIELEAGNRSASGSTDITIEGPRAAFVTPTGNIACTVNAIAAVCQVSDAAFQPQAGHLVPGVLGDCNASTANAVMTSESGTWTCVDDPLAPLAAVDQGGWWVDEVDGTTTKVGDLTVAALPYGSSITVGSVRCTSAESGVTCRNNELGRQFTLSHNSYNFGG